MAQKFLCVYHDWLATFQGLGYERAGRLLVAALEYDINGKPPDLDGNLKFVWPLIQASIDRNHEHYKNICETNRRNVSSRYDRIRPNTTEYDRSKENTIEEKKTEEKRIEPKKATAFAPPTLEEVQAYCWERSNNIDPQYFLDYYSSNGWKVGRNPMKDWKAAVRTWERKEAPGRPSGKRTNNIFAEIAVEEGLF